jgi:hypothetical protein
MPALLRWAAGSASSAAGLRAISVRRFMTATRGGWIRSPAFGVFAKGPNARTPLR